MKTIEMYILFKQKQFENHPFFLSLDKANNLDDVTRFMPDLAHWVMSFQDALRIIEGKIVTPFLKTIAKHRRAEDAGHENWFLSDLTHFNKSADFYSKSSQSVRDSVYAIMSEIYRNDSEAILISLLLTLESAGHVFFNKISDAMKRLGEDHNLKYFSSSHLDVELSHAVFEEQLESRLFSIDLSPELQLSAIQMIDRCYAAFNQMFKGIL